MKVKLLVNRHKFGAGEGAKDFDLGISLVLVKEFVFEERHKFGAGEGILLQLWHKFGAGEGISRSHWA